MTVYVDDMRAPFGRMIMCHMEADTLEELHAMADRIGVARRWFQGPHNGHSRFPHYDIALSKRALAVQYGAKEVTQRELVLIMRAKEAPMPDPESISRKRIEELRAEHFHRGPDEQCIRCPMRFPCDTYKALTLALAADDARKEGFEAGRHHAKGIVQGGTSLEIAEAILAEHEPEMQGVKVRDKLDDELCRVCALASMLKGSALAADGYREALEKVKKLSNARRWMRLARERSDFQEGYLTALNEVFVAMGEHEFISSEWEGAPSRVAAGAIGGKP